MSLLIGLLALGSLSRPVQELDAAAIYKKVLPSVMTVHAVLPQGERIGTAFLAFKDGLAVTCWHVVKGATSATVKFADGEEFDITGIVDKDEKRDLALIRVKVADRPLLSLGKGDPEIGSKAFAIGAPLGLDFSISEGIVSQLRSDNGSKLYQFSSPVSKGNSGGPLINGNGEVIGVVSLQATEGQNLNFATPVAYVKGFDITLKTTPWRDVKVVQQTDTGETTRDAKIEADIVDVLRETHRFMVDYHVNIERLTKVNFKPLETTFLEKAITLADKANDLSQEETTGQLEKARVSVVKFLTQTLETVTLIREGAQYRPLMATSNSAISHYHELCRTFVALFRTTTLDPLKGTLDDPSLEELKKQIPAALLSRLFGARDQKGWLPKSESIIARQRFYDGWTTLNRMIFDIDSTGYVFGFIPDMENPAKLDEVPEGTPPSDWGFEKDDIVLSVAGKEVSSIEEMKTELIRIGKKTSDVIVKRKDKEVKIRVNPSNLLKD